VWVAELKDAATGMVRTVRARALINAAGPWVNDIIGRVAGLNSSRNVRLVKGSHIVVPKFWEGRHAYLVQNHDKRVIFINPYEENLALVGTTDIPCAGRPEDVVADESEIDYLIGSVNRYFKRKLSRGDVVHSFSGVRPLYDDNADNPSAVTRDYIFELDGGDGRAPLLSVFGGKITTFRKLSEHALEKIAPYFPSMGKAWTAGATLPGGDLPDSDFERFMGQLRQAYPWMPGSLTKHYARLYGTRIHDLVGTARSVGDLGMRFGPNFHEQEARFLIETEWARTAEDLIVRRTKHGLHMSPAEKAALEEWCSTTLAKAG
jgi:glycerol-3-phosphate dehydrogenase